MVYTLVRSDMTHRFYQDGCTCLRVWHRLFSTFQSPLIFCTKRKLHSPRVLLPLSSFTFLASRHVWNRHRLPFLINPRTKAKIFYSGIVFEAPHQLVEVVFITICAAVPHPGFRRWADHGIEVVEFTADIKQSGGRFLGRQSGGFSVKPFALIRLLPAKESATEFFQRKHSSKCIVTGFIPWPFRGWIAYPLPLGVLFKSTMDHLECKETMESTGTFVPVDQR